MSGSKTTAEHKALFKAAEDLGFDVVKGTNTTLLLDLDGGRGINMEVFNAIVEEYGRPDVEYWMSKSGKGRHAVLRFSHLTNFSNIHACALECALGSDPLRCVLDIVHAKAEGNAYSDDVRVLFKPTERVPADLLDSFQTLSEEEQRRVFTTHAKLTQTPTTETNDRDTWGY